MRTCGNDFASFCIDRKELMSYCMYRTEERLRGNKAPVYLVVVNLSSSVPPKPPSPPIPDEYADEVHNKPGAMAMGYVELLKRRLATTGRDSPSEAVNSENILFKPGER